MKELLTNQSKLLLKPWVCNNTIETQCNLDEVNGCQCETEVVQTEPCTEHDTSTTGSLHSADKATQTDFPPFSGKYFCMCFLFCLILYPGKMAI